MIVSLNVPDELFQEFINSCEYRTGVELPYVKAKVSTTKSYHLKSDIDDKDMKLYKWIAALVVNDMFK